MVLDNLVLPPQLRKGPAVGFLALTDVLAEFRLSSSRLDLDWEKLENTLQKLHLALKREIDLDRVGHALALEICLHRDRVGFVIVSWQRGYADLGMKQLQERGEQEVRKKQRELLGDRTVYE